MNEASQPQRLRGKNVIVIGASRALGRALVNEALRRGAKSVYEGGIHEAG